MEGRNFRTCIIGGYQKDDVLDYVEELEEELKELKLWKSQSEAEREDGSQSRELAILREENERLKMELSQKNLEVQEKQDFDFYNSAKEMLLDAQETLEVARNQAEQLRIRSEKEIQEQQEAAMKQFRTELKEKGISILSTRYKLKEQIEGLKTVREEIARIRVNIEQTANQLPSKTEDAYLECEENQ